MHVDPYYPAFNAISQTFPLSMVESTYTNYQPATLDSIAISVFVNIGWVGQLQYQKPRSKWLFWYWTGTLSEPHGNQCNDDEWWDIRNTWDRVSGLLTPLVNLVHWPLENIIGYFLCDRPLYPFINWLIPVSCASRSEFICPFTPNVFANDLSISFRHMKHCCNNILCSIFFSLPFFVKSLWFPKFFSLYTIIFP